MRAALATLLLATLLAPAASAAPLSPEETQQVLVHLDDMQRNGGDYKALIYLESKQKDKEDLVYQLVAYRRDADDKLMMLFLKPKTEAGKGYLRIDKNLFMYDPTTGKWDRRTERERIAGTDSNRADYDESRLAEEFVPTYVGEEKLGKYAVHHITMKAKSDADVAYPVMDIWVDQATGNLLKQQERAASGKLMRTTYYPKWDKLWSPSKGADVYFPREIRIFDEVEKGNRTVVAIQEVDLSALPLNIFTKAWLESKTR
ncbi:MAG: outer membrane lipoprotein-sorting protein [Deltaproteobacteria bacterium]|nr:MAG: outer membrane lipoprotein-sorting protein [Deltaproteobacteria bacterium]